MAAAWDAPPPPHPPILRGCTVPQTPTETRSGGAGKAILSRGVGNPKSAGFKANRFKRSSWAVQRCSNNALASCTPPLFDSPTRCFPNIWCVYASLTLCGYSFGLATGCGALFAFPQCTQTPRFLPKSQTFCSRAIWFSATSMLCCLNETQILNLFHNASKEEKKERGKGTKFWIVLVSNKKHNIPETLPAEMVWMSPD